MKCSRRDVQSSADEMVRGGIDVWNLSGSDGRGGLGPVMLLEMREDVRDELALVASGDAGGVLRGIDPREQEPGKKRLRVLTNAHQEQVARLPRGSFEERK